MSDEMQEQEQAPEQAEAVAVGKSKKKGSGNLIADVAVEMENLSKTKALHLASSLAEDIDTNSFRLGGVLKVIFDHSWFEGFESFDAFVYERFGFKARKARYLMDIYTHLVDKQIPWEKVKHLGWTKLKDLAEVLTLENVDEWVAKAEQATVLELQAMLKAKPEGEALEGGKTSSDVVTKKFQLKADQLEVVNAAINKAKAEGGTEFDNVALELICAAYLGGSIQVAKPDLKAVIKEAGWQPTLETFSEVYPEIDIDVKVPEGA